MKKPIDHYLEGVYSTELIREDRPSGPIFVARLRALPGCLAQGTTEEEARAGLEAIREDYLRARYERGVELPEPDFETSVVEQVWGATFTGGGDASVWEVAKVYAPQQQDVRVNRQVVAA